MSGGKTEINAVLRTVYYNPDTGFGNQTETLEEALKLNPNITKEDVRDFMRAQKVTQFRPVRGKNGFVPPEALFQIQFDVAYMDRVSAGAYKYALIAIDAFSKKLVVIPQRSRTAAETSKSLEKVLKELGLPAYALSDDGSEFKREFKDLLDDYDIPHRITRGHAIFAERVIRTIKEALVKRVESMGGTWYTYIDTVVKRYNQKKHGTTQMTPNDAMKLENRTTIRKRLQSVVKTSKKHPTLQVGSKVRVMKKPAFGASYRVTEDAWSRTVFTVSEIKRTDMGAIYTLSESANQTYLRHELLRITGPELPPVEADAEAAVAPLYAPGARRLRRIPPERLLRQ
jgi:hypothetical protein